MPHAPQPPAKPSTPAPQQKPINVAQAARQDPHQPPAHDPKYTREQDPDAPPIGARPHDPHDPQSAKFEAQAGPPKWDQPGKAQRANEPPPPDGQSSADEQRQRAAEVEAGGPGVIDQRPADERPTIDKHALAGGGAFVKAGAQKQVEGVTPPTKRE